MVIFEAIVIGSLLENSEEHGDLQSQNRQLRKALHEIKDVLQHCKLNENYKIGLMFDAERNFRLFQDRIIREDFDNMKFLINYFNRNMWSKIKDDGFEKIQKIKKDYGMTEDELRKLQNFTTVGGDKK